MSRPHASQPRRSEGERPSPTAERASSGLLLAVLGLSVVLGLMRGMGQLASWPWLYALLALPGTLMHELAHWAMAWGLGAEPNGLSLWPRMQPDGNWVLGQVHFVPNAWNVASIAIAPLGLLPVGAGWLALAMRLRRWPWRLLCLYLSACAWGSAWPSSVDWRLALRAPASWPLAFLLVMGAGGIALVAIQRWRRAGHNPPTGA